MPMVRIDAQTLQAALIGYQHESSVIAQKIADIQKQMGKTGTSRQTAAGSALGGTKRVMSAAARKRIAAAQKKRWAQYHAKTGTTAKKTVVKKRHLSPEGRARIAEAAKRRWAAARNNKAVGA